MATSYSKSWVDGPFKLIPAAKSSATKVAQTSGAKIMASEMSLVHNCLIRGVNAIYLQCDNVVSRGSSKDKLDFANFACQWGCMIEEHHHTEEAVFFPEINELANVPGLMDANVEEHALFHDGLAKFIEYLAKVKGGEEELDGTTLKTIIDDFMPTLRGHLENEIDTLLVLEKYADKCDWSAWFKAKADKVVKDSLMDSTYRYDVFPLAMILHDKTFEGGVWANFPPMPWIMFVAVRWMFMSTRKDWWRFSGCDFCSMPKELPFA